MPMPPASLEMLVTTLATEAMMALGQMPHPQTGEGRLPAQQAKYLIDTIDVLCEKTKGNVTAEETELMDQLLHQLRMAYVELTAAPKPALSAKTLLDSSSCWRRANSKKRHAQLDDSPASPAGRALRT